MISILLNSTEKEFEFNVTQNEFLDIWNSAIDKGFTVDKNVIGKSDTASRIGKQYPKRN